MGGGQPSEPHLPPAYIAVHAAYQRLTRAERANRRRQSVHSAMAVEYERLARLRARLLVELADVDAAESRLRRPLLPRSRRRRHAELLTEQADVRALRSEIAARHLAWEELATSLGPAAAFDPAAEIAAAEAELDVALAAWQTAHQVAGSNLGARLDALERRHGEITALIGEVDEAAGAVRQAAAALLIAARAVIRTPTLWNPHHPDRLGARMVRVFSRSRVPTAESAVGRFQRWLLQLDAELADLHQSLGVDAAPPVALRLTMERWFERVFSERLVHGEIDLSALAVADCRDGLRQLGIGLADYRRSLEQLLERAEDDRRAALLEHPGVV